MYICSTICQLLIHIGHPSFRITHGEDLLDLLTGPTRSCGSLHKYTLNSPTSSAHPLIKYKQPDWNSFQREACVVTKELQQILITNILLHSILFLLQGLWFQLTTNGGTVQSPIPENGSSSSVRIYQHTPEITPLPLAPSISTQNRSRPLESKKLFADRRIPQTCSFDHADQL